MFFFPVPKCLFGYAELLEHFREEVAADFLAPILNSSESIPEMQRTVATFTLSRFKANFDASPFCSLSITNRLGDPCPFVNRRLTG